MQGASSTPIWPLLLVVGYPLTALLIFEASRRLDHRRVVAGNLLRQVLYLVLPTGAIWLVLRRIAQLPPDNLGVRIAVTVFALSALYVVLRLAQVLLEALLDEERRAPKLLLDIVRIALAIGCGAVVVSNVWDVNLANLLAAMGVGSIVLGFALQDVAGNFVSGLGLLYQNKFSIGDWIVVEGKVAQVIELDWRSVTLQAATGERIIAANSSLAKSNVVIAARGGEQRWAEVPLEFGTDIAPERVRAAVLETGADMLDVLGTDGILCRVSAYTPTSIRYSALLHVANPSILSGPRDEFLSRFWYVAQRHGLRLNIPSYLVAEAPAAMSEASRLKLLAETGLFGEGEASLTTIARKAEHLCFRAGEQVTAGGAPEHRAFVVIAGCLRALVPGSNGAELPMERLAPGHMFVVAEAMHGDPSPVRLVAERDTELLAIPAAAIAPLLEGHGNGRDVAAVVEARRRSIAALTRSLRAAA